MRCEPNQRMEVGTKFWTRCLPMWSHRARLAQSHCHNLDGTLLDARGSVFVLERNPYPEDLGVLHVPPRLAQPRHPFGRPTCEHQECALSAANLPRDGKVDAGWI